jgi:hypothetical protein
MEPREHYTYKDFKRYAREEFANEFRAFCIAYISTFERKTYFDDNNAARDIDVLLVGRSIMTNPTWSCPAYAISFANGVPAREQPRPFILVSQYLILYS